MQENRISATVPRIDEVYFVAIERSLRTATEKIFSKVSDLDARQLPKAPTCSDEFMAYCDYGVKRIINVMQYLREFSILSFDLKKIFFQVSSFS